MLNLNDSSRFNIKASFVIPLSFLCCSLVMDSVANADCKVHEFGTSLFKDKKWIVESRGDRWKVKAPHFYKNLRLGVAFGFSSVRAKADLYIYDAGISNINEIDLEQQLRQAVSDIVHRYQRYDPDAELYELAYPKSMYSHISFINDALAIFVSKPSTDEVTFVSMGVANGCFHKVRYTQAVASDKKLSEKRVEGAFGISRFLNSLHFFLWDSGYFR